MRAPPFPPADISAISRQAEIAGDIFEAFRDDDVKTLMGGCIEVLAHAVNFATAAGVRRDALLADIANDIRIIADFYRGH